MISIANSDVITVVEELLSKYDYTIADLYYAKQAMLIAENADDTSREIGEVFTVFEEINSQRDANLDDPSDFIVDEYSNIANAAKALGLR